MNIFEAMKHILYSPNLEDKLISLDHIHFDGPYPRDFILPKFPERNNKLSFSDKQLKFPKAQSLSSDNKKAQALNSFANHELLAIEMMASAILLYPNETEEDKRFKKGILKTLIDEQKHLSLYNERLHDLGYEFGDFPLNDFFWKQMPNLKTPKEYCAVMALTFEAANLDFALYYEKVFKNLDDEKSANIMKVIYEDEISHVRLGVNYLNRWRKDKSLWDYYLEVLPFPMTPERSRGIEFDEASRIEAKLDLEFIEKVKEYSSGFSVTKRKS